MIGMNVNMIDNGVEEVTVNMETEPVSAYISNLECYCARIKELHWSAEDDKTHILCDELRDEICELQDKLAEIYMGITGTKFRLGFLSDNVCDLQNITNLPIFCRALISDTCEVIEQIERCVILRGIKGELEEFVGYLQTILYKETQK